MSYCKKILGSYSEEKDVYNVISYALDMKKTKHLICGGNILISARDAHAQPAMIASQFITMQDRMKQRGKRIYHVVISFDRVIDEISLKEIDCIARGILEMYQNYQSLYVLHEDTSNRHLHIVFNNIPYEGSEMLSTKLNMMKIENYVNDSIKYFLWEKKGK